MYDIIRAKGISPEPFHFSKLYFYEDVKGRIAKVKSLDEAVKLKNKKELVMLEDYKEDIGLMKLFGSGNSAFLIDLSRIMETYGMQRATEMARMRRFVRVCVKYEIPFAFASFAKDEFSMRNSRELCHIATLLGLNVGQAKFALERLGSYLD
ncbi:MAG: hypothetical protein WC488_04720 [Candidatus Micrarchaeia archaeon]